MSNTLLISIFCTDKTGLIANITAALFDLDVNLGDANFAVLGEGAEFTAVCEAPSAVAADELQRQLQTLAVLESADIKVTPFKLSTFKKESDSITHQIILQGQDQPGLVARITEVFIDYEANIVRMNAQKVPAENKTEYLLQLAVSIPAARSEACLATISNTASWLNMRCHSTEVADID